MKIGIRRVENFNNRLFVEFECDYGAGQGLWLSNPPTVGDTYEVEIDCEDELQVGQNAHLSDRNQYLITFIESMTKLTAKIEDVYEDGAAAIRFGGAIMVAQFVGDAPSKESWVDITTSHLALNDISP